MAMALAALVTACAIGVRTPASRPEVWLLMGQSNMSGRGDLAELAPAANASDPRVQVWGNDGVLRLAREPLDAAEGQRDAVSVDAMAGVGPGLAFAKARLASHPDRRIILVPCAKGGTSIAQWYPAQGRTSLLGSCVARAQDASRHGRLAGALWYQGETDARTLAMAEAWAGQFATMLAALRQRLDRPDLPILVVSIGDRQVAPGETRPPGWDRVQQDQNALSGPNLDVVPAAGLALNPDGLHLSTTGQQGLGSRLAQAAEGLSAVDDHRGHPVK